VDGGSGVKVLVVFSPDGCLGRLCGLRPWASVRASSTTLTVPGYGTTFRTRRALRRPGRGQRQPHASGAET